MNNSTIRERNKATPVMLGAFFLPVMVHVIAFSRDCIRQNYLVYGRLDLAIFLITVIYLSAGTLAMREKKSGYKFLLVTYSLLIPLSLFELGALILDGSESGLPWQPMRRTSFAADTMPGIHGRIDFTVNKMGVRAPDVWPPSRNDRILCIGGSTTECMYVTNEKSWPWLLGAKLSKQVGRTILVANAGRSGHFTLHHIYQIAHYKYARDYGLIIVLPGINDAGTLFRNNYEERASMVPHEALIYGGTDTDRAYYARTWLVRRFHSLQQKNAHERSSVVQDPEGQWIDAERKQRQLLLRTNTISSLPPQLAKALERYRLNLIDIINLCRERKQKLIFMTQPTMYQKSMSDKLSLLLWGHTDNAAYTPDVLADVNTAFNQMLQRVCVEYNIPCIDLASQLPKDTSVFYDDCHFNQNGCELVSSIIADYVMPQVYGHSARAYRLNPASHGTRQKVG